jgi:glycerol-3-phosphate dehydrogenase
VSSCIPSRAPLDGKHFDVVVVGGGINGVAIAGECARAGQRTLLVEKSDFGAGTTSRSSRIIHGGLRYLEHGEIGLVRESLRERERLLRSHPHLVRRRKFVLAVQDGKGMRSALAIRAGLFIYGRIAHVRNTSSRGTALEESLQAGGKLACFDYQDAQCEFPERLMAEWLTAAIRAGAEVRNHSDLLEASFTNGVVRRLRLRDALTGAESQVDCDWLINATGPWADRFCAQAGVPSRTRMVGGVRGSHIVLPIFPGAPANPVYTEAQDGRPILILPWNGQLMLGTTEVLDDGNPGEAAPSLHEIDYLLRQLALLFPNSGLGAHDIRYAFAGIRPLPYAPGENASAISRRHVLFHHAHDGGRGVISVIGGKLTTAMKLARDCVRKMGMKVSEPVVDVCAAPSSDGIESALDQWARQISGVIGISRESAHAIAQWHGAEALSVTRLAASDPVWRASICDHSPHIMAEVAQAIRYEKAITLGDVLLRRVPVALGACWSEDCSHESAEKIGRALGWTSARISSELEQFEAERAAFLHPSERVWRPQLTQSGGR